jgi:integrase
MSAAAARVLASTWRQWPSLADQYIAGADTAAGRKCRRQVTEAFTRLFGDFDTWLAAPAPDRLAAPLPVRGFAAWAAVATGVAVDAAYVVAVHSKWGLFLAEKHPQTAAMFRAEAASLGFDGLEVDKMWSKLSQISVIAGCPSDLLTADEYILARDAFAAAVIRLRGHRPKTLATPLFGLDAVMFQRGQAPVPALRKPWQARSVHEVDWDHVAVTAPTMAATMRRYLTQVAISLRPSSVEVIDTTLRQLAGMLIAEHPDVTTVAEIGRQHIEAFKTWLAARPGYRKQNTLSKTTLGMRMGHLRAFFERIAEWNYDDIPTRIPVFASDRPLKDRPLPRFLDDPSAAKLMTATRALPDRFDRLAVELLARTGMRKGELLGLTVDAVVQIGSAYWLRTPVGKMRTDRYIPLHPAAKALIDDWVAQRADWQASDLLFTDRGRPIPPTRVDKAVQRAAAAAGLGHVHPHQLRHTLATQAINRGMSLEAIAALLGHKTMTMTMVYARIADRTVANEYFAVTEKVEALYQQQNPATLPADAEGTQMRKLRAEVHRRMLGNGYCARPVELDCHFESICESCTFFVTTIEFRPTLQAQRDDAERKGQLARKRIFDGLIDRLDATGT